MEHVLNWYEMIRDFLEMGGTVLTVIAVLMLLMWFFIIERVLYFKTSHKKRVKRVIVKWQKRAERNSWNAHQIRAAMLSRTYLALNHNLSFIKTLVAICPLLGLMGTVTGMIEVFDVMAVFGNGNARSMAAGVSKATIPTMAGMVGALAGVFATTWLNRSAASEMELLQDQLTTET